MESCTCRHGAGSPAQRGVSLEGGTSQGGVGGQPRGGFQPRQGGGSGPEPDHMMGKRDGGARPLRSVSVFKEGMHRCESFPVQLQCLVS